MFFIVTVVCHAEASRDTCFKRTEALSLLGGPGGGGQLWRISVAKGGKVFRKDCFRSCTSLCVTIIRSIRRPS
eukprot:1332613-Amorphochlora_amoeboformis.AAC.1